MNILVKIMKKILLTKDCPIYCLVPSEAIMLDDHIDGYFNNGIKINEGDVVVDVGANIGVLGVRLSEKFNKIKIYSFEPIPNIFSVLKKNCKLTNNPDFKVFENGLGDKKEKKEFTYFPNSPALSTANPDAWEKDPKMLIDAVKGSLKNAPKKFWWAKFIPSFLAPLFAKYLTINKKKFICEIITLSNFIANEKISKIHFLKIDCEGLEWKVLQGIKNNDWEKILSCVIEVHNINNRLEKICKLLESNGFKIILEKEKSLKKTKLVNVFATKK
ncbi:MAG: hypothetical protein CMP68_01365 [Flavobacteriales bacterium]|nr:hypothetical protein [Flavobacteriales bacterium]